MTQGLQTDNCMKLSASYCCHFSGPTHQRALLRFKKILFPRNQSGDSCSFWSLYFSQRESGLYCITGKSDYITKNYIFVFEWNYYSLFKSSKSPSWALQLLFTTASSCCLRNEVWIPNFFFLLMRHSHWLGSSTCGDPSVKAFVQNLSAVTSKSNDWMEQGSCAKWLNLSHIWMTLGKHWHILLLMCLLTSLNAIGKDICSLRNEKRHISFKAEPPFLLHVLLLHVFLLPRATACPCLLYWQTVTGILG